MVRLPLTIKYLLLLAVVAVWCGCNSRQFDSAFRVALPTDATVLHEYTSTPSGSRIGVYWAKLQISHETYLRLVKELGLSHDDAGVAILPDQKNLEWWDPPAYKEQVACKDRFIIWQSVDLGGEKAQGRTVAQFYNGVAYIFKNGPVK